MIITEFVVYRGQEKKVKDLSPTCSYKVEVGMSPMSSASYCILQFYYEEAGHHVCQSCIMKNRRTLIGIGTKFGKT